MTNPAPSPKLSTTERLALPRLGSNPITAITRNAFAEILQVCPRTASAILHSLVAKGFAARTPQRHNTRFWRTRNADSGTVTICPGTTLDDSIATLQARAARADTLEEALSAILNILADHGIRIPKLVAPDAEQLNFDDFVLFLQESGWDAVRDAQHEQIKYLWQKLFLTQLSDESR